MSPRTQLWLLSAAAALLLVACSAPQGESRSSPDQDWQILLGVPAQEGPNPTRFETREVLTRDPERRPGFVIVIQPPARLATTAYSAHTVHYLPGKPQHLRGEFAQEVPEAAQVGLHTTPATFQGTATMQFNFDEGDPLGPWRVEVFVDGAFKKALKFRLAEPNAAGEDQPQE